jgi:hypothetical protein
MINKHWLAALILIAAFIGPTPAQVISFPELQGYRKNTEFPVYSPDNIRNFNSSSAETFLSYGFVDLNIAEYKKGKNIIRIEIFRHTDNRMAFGIYSTERSPAYRFLNLGTQGYNTDGNINFFKGEYYVRIRTVSNNGKNLQMAESLALRVANMLPGNTEMPAALSRFPESGKKVNEETYISTNVLGHNFIPGAFRANYESGPDIFSLYLTETKSPSETWKTVEAYLKKTGEDAPESDNGKYLLSDGYNGPVFLAWIDRTIVIITGLSRDQADIADQYISEIIK